MPFPRVACRFLPLVLLTFAALSPLAAAPPFALHPKEISAAQSTALPFRLSGRLNVTFAGKNYFGTATCIRRYTGLTAGHLLYDQKAGFGGNLNFEQGLYNDLQTRVNRTLYFAVLSGYQSAANVDPDSDASFNYDMGYLLFSSQSLNNEWAAFGPATDALTSGSDFLVLGYAAQSFSGDQQAFVEVPAPFYELLGPGLYENTAYYTEGGMSGGPLYVTNGDNMQIAAVTVAGTSFPDPAYSDVRVITPDEQTLFTEAEYSYGLVQSGMIKGPTSLAVGGHGKYKTGVVFADGVIEGRDLPATYDELYLKAVGPHKKRVSITKLKTGKFKVALSYDLPSGSVVTLQLLRSTLLKSAQAPLQTMSVTVQ